jgi:iron complex transport system substrate-binding protein
MRLFAPWALLLALAAAHSAAAAERPHRIASLNLCMDELVVALADPADIASLSPLARDPDLSTVAAEAQRFADNRASAEEILREKADLVLAETSAATETIALLLALGTRVETMDMVERLDQIAPAVRRVGGWLGREDRAEALLDRMQRDLAAIVKPATRRSALLYEPNGWSPGMGTMSQDILEAAGFTMQAARLGIAGYAPLPLETVLANPPDVLIVERYRPDEISLADRWLDHPALRHMNVIHVELPTSHTVCGTPAIAETVRYLAALNAPGLASRR